VVSLRGFSGRTCTSLHWYPGSLGPHSLKSVLAYGLAHTNPVLRGFACENYHDCSTDICIFVFLAAQGQAEDHYIYKDAQGKLVISNKVPPPGSNIIRKLDMPEYRDTQMQQVQESGSARSTGKLEGSSKQELKK
jgi:hypothetical protein